MSAIARIPALRPDVAVLDRRLLDGSGVEVCREVRNRVPGLGTCMLTSYADDDALFQAGWQARRVMSSNRSTGLIWWGPCARWRAASR